MHKEAMGILTRFHGNYRTPFAEREKAPLISVLLMQTTCCLNMKNIDFLHNENFQGNSQPHVIFHNRERPLSKTKPIMS